MGKYKITLYLKELWKEELPPFNLKKQIPCRLMSVSTGEGNETEKIWLINTWNMAGKRISGRLSRFPRLRRLEFELKNETSETLITEYELQKKLACLIERGLNTDPRFNPALDYQVHIDLSKIIKKYQWEIPFENNHNTLSELITNLVYRDKIIMDTADLIQTVLKYCESNKTLKKYYLGFVPVWRKNVLLKEIKNLLTLEYQLAASSRINKAYARDGERLKDGALQIIENGYQLLTHECNKLGKNIETLKIEKLYLEDQVDDLMVSERNLKESLALSKIIRNELVQKLIDHTTLVLPKKISECEERMTAKFEDRFSKLEAFYKNQKALDIKGKEKEPSQFKGSSSLPICSLFKL